MEKRRHNQRGEGSRLRSELVQAAFRVLDRSPATQLSLRMVAREAGVAPPSVYDHFPDARSLMAAIVRECWRELGEEMERSSREVADDDSFANLCAQMSAYVAYAMERPSRYQLLFALQPLEADGGQDLPGPIQPAYRNVRAWIDRLEAEGARLPAVDAHATAVLTLAIAHGRIALAQTAPYRPRNTMAGVQAFVLDALERLFAP